MIRLIFASLIFTAAMSTSVVQPCIATAQDTEVGTLRRNQYTQQQAQALTRQLVSQVLDLQAAQLKQNGLTNVPIYSDIVQMRENLDELIRNEMQGVVQKLILAQEVQGKERVTAITEARDEVRKVLLTFMAERQRLYRRMRLARLNAQVRELIAIQENVSTQTRSLQQLPIESRDSAALANLSRQTDAVMMFHHLEEALLDMRGWGGSLANSAIAGQQILKEENAANEVQGALASIRDGRYSGANVHQDAFIAALYKILEDLQKAQGLADNSLETAMNEIEKLKDEQQTVKEETSQDELTPEKADELSQKQEAIQKKLEELAKEMTSQPENVEPLEEASQSAAEAVAELFEADQEAAIEKQEEVIAKLETLKEQLIEQAVPANVASADEREEQIAALEEAKQDLENALEKQNDAQQQLQKTPEDASAVAQMQKEAGQELDAAAKTENLPDAVKPMIAEAKATANEAAAAAEKAAAEKTNSDNQQAATDAQENAIDTTRQALENVSSTLADAKRQQLATKIGELARAAEALDRAAAAQQEISRDAAKVANDPQQSQNQDMAAVAETQSDIAAVANRVAEGTKNTAPQAADAMKQAQSQIDKASDAAKQMAKPQQSAEATGKQAQDLQNQSREAQQKLNQAAKALREAAKEAANQLAQTAGEQLDQIDNADDGLNSMPQQKDPAKAQAQMEALANEAGMISPEAAARLRKPGENAAGQNEMAMNDAQTPATPNNASEDGSNDQAPSNANAGEESASSMDGESGNQEEASGDAQSPMDSSPMGNDSPMPTPQQRQEQVQQARAELAGRRQPIAADKQAAEEIASLLDNLAGSSEKIQELSEQFMANNAQAAAAENNMGETPEAAAEGSSAEQPMSSGEDIADNSDSSSPSEGEPGSPASENPIASQLAESMQQFANSQRKATQLAANAAQQGQIANQPVREALQTASRLPVPMSPMNPPADAAMGDPADASGSPQPEDLAGEPSEAGQEASSDGEPSQGSPMSGSEAPQSGNSSQMASQPSPSQGSPGQPPSTDMGNSMVSPTPQVTAQALAGAEVMESLWDQMPELIADGQSESGEVASIDPQGMAAPASAMLDNPNASQPASPTDAMAQNAMQGQPANSQATNSQASNSTEGSEANTEESASSGGTSNSNPAARTFEKEPWFTKLPPGVQQSIRASVRRSPPPGYEERLRRYFENVD
ncbi:hypothetical protein [Bremerella alba]|uniref:Uncharacterized protein n=1 Tax=Bremerella alba TaxID=980252 RepID=A0A7V8V314_9BACT|nr:hypothetical protein [Bremerella alba]MBA2113739.1 hypothetical protein [Bremerella alba]